MFEKIKNSPDYRWYVLATITISTFMSTLDSSIVNVAMPTISDQLQADLSTLQWTVTAYLLALSSLLPVFGRLGDLLGRKKVYALGFLVFTVGSVLCGLAVNIWFLVAARVVQAVGAAMLMANSVAIITATFPLQERGRALGLASTVAAIGTLTGPALGGVLIGLAGWRSIFYINVPIGIIAYVIAHSIIPNDSPQKEKEGFDYVGALLFSVGITSLLLAINNGESWGWSSQPILLGLILGGVLLASFIINERKVAHPIIDLSLFNIRPFVFGILAAFLCFVAIYANNLLLPFYLQDVLYYNPSKVGLTMATFPLGMAVAAPLSGRASDKYGPLYLTTGALAICAIAFFYFSTLTATSSFYQVLPGTLLLGIGLGMFQSPNSSSVMSSVPRNKLGQAGGINSLIRNVGMIMGIALSVTLFQAWGGVAKPAPEQVSAFMSAYRSVMLVAMTIAIAAAAISLNRKSYHHQGAGSPVRPDPETPPAAARREAS